MAQSCHAKPFTADPPPFPRKRLQGRILALALSSSGCLFSPAILAQTDAICAPDWIAPPMDVSEQPAPNQVDADVLSQPRPLEYDLSGQVRLSQPGLVILADRARIQRDTQTAQLFGQVVLQRPDLLATGTRVDLDQQAETAQLLDVRFQFKSSRAHGAADQAHFDQKADVATLNHASFTTCKLEKRLFQSAPLSADNGKYDWEMTFGELEVNNAERRIHGWDTWLHFQEVPVFYTPYINFPMDDRASGFLFPRFGGHQSLTQNDSHSYLAVPYYFNLAPHYDDTLTVMAMQERGLVLDNEFRYRQPNHQGTLNISALNDQLTTSKGLAKLNDQGDVVYGDKIDTRWRAKFVGGQQWAEGVRSHIDWQEVSDEYFYNDIPLDTGLDTATYAPRHLQLNASRGDLSAAIRLQDYLTLRDSNVYNYEKRPQITLNYRPSSLSDALPSLSFDLSANTTEFAISQSGHNRPEGRRDHLSPGLRYEVFRPYGRLKAEARWHQVSYHVTEPGAARTQSHQTQAGQYALRGNLIFERPLSLADTPLVQTLEPELQYLYVPYVNQSQQPLFDTGRRSLHFSNLFSANRFTGADRIGDTQQVTAALTTRFLTRDGRPLAEAAIGQIYYLQDRKVTLNDSTVEAEANTVTSSDYFIKLGLQAGPLSLASTSQYDRKHAGLVSASNRFKYHYHDRFEFLMVHNLTNQGRANERQDLVAGAFWQVTDTWSAGGYLNYDFAADRNTESRYALRYDDCCWASELSIKQTELDNGLYNYSIMYLIELKGLSGMGTPFNQFLEDKLNF
jgi:LPS-assembly protein